MGSRAGDRGATDQQGAPRADDGPAVRLRSVVALAGRFPVLAGLDLEVARGEVVVLVGPNGAGKTSLLRVLAGLGRISRGEGVVLGHDLRHAAASVRRRVGLLGAAGGLYPDLTVAQNLDFWTTLAGATPGAAGAAMEALGLTGRLRDVPVSRLSTGQRRRCALAVLVARRPELWLLDEPHAGLDAEGRDLLDGLLGRAARAGATVVFASHELDRAERVADRLVTVDGGVVVGGVVVGDRLGGPS